MRAFHFFSFDWLNIGAPVACLGGFRSRMLVQALLPIFMLTVTPPLASFAPGGVPTRGSEALWRPRR
jgi:hypothetical protein